MPATRRTRQGQKGADIPPNAKQRQLIIEKRRAQVAELLVKGFNVAAICRKLDESDKAIVADMRVLKERWETQADDDYRTARRRELLDLDMQERELWDAWENSKKPMAERSVTETELVGENGRPTVPHRTKTARTRASWGDVRVMQQILAVCHSRRKLLGLDAEESVELTDNTGVLVVPGKISPDEWAKTVQEQTEAVKRRVPDLKIVGK